MKSDREEHLERLLKEANEIIRSFSAVDGGPDLVIAPQEAQGHE